MIPYKTKINKLPGSNLGEISKSAWKIYHQIEKLTKRKPYVRSKYFKKDKIFFDFFWDHLKSKSPKERFKRLKLFTAAIDTIKNSTCIPVIKNNPNKKSEIFYRFSGQLKTGELFIVQIKENKISKRKYFMSCFPVE
ncbi:MAG: hypothetical protein WC451_04140 [Patescibacteria group bacterium]